MHVRVGPAESKGQCNVRNTAKGSTYIDLFGRECSYADPSGVGFGDPKHIADIHRGDAQASARPTNGAV